MSVTAAQVKELRERTGAGMMDCKRALVECEGDIEKAMETLRLKGLAAAEKKASRSADEGLVFSYIHAGGKVGVLLELNCETDFVAKTDDFQALGRDLCLQIAAMSPDYVTADEVPEDVLEREKRIYRQQAEDEGKPAAVIERIVDGRLNKFYTERCLLAQPFIKDEGKARPVEQVVKQVIGKLGENIVVRRFSRFRVGEQ